MWLVAMAEKIVFHHVHGALVDDSVKLDFPTHISYVTPAGVDGT